MPKPELQTTDLVERLRGMWRLDNDLTDQIANEIERLRRVEENALAMRSVVESLGVMGAGKPPKSETIQASCRLLVKAFDEGCAA